MEDRISVVISEEKNTIARIKAKYNKNLSDGNALKIASLEVTNDLFKKASNIAGVLFLIDIIVPDSVIGMDEVMLGAITAACKTANTIIQNKINQIASSGSSELQEEEVMKIAESINSIKNNVKRK